MDHLGRETTIAIGGTQYRLSRFTRRIHRQFLRWVNDTLPDPLNFNPDGFPPHVQEIMVKEAVAAAELRRSVSGPEVVDLMVSDRGRIKILSLLLAQHHPEAVGQAEALFDQCDPDRLDEAIVETLGRMPPDESEAERQAMERMGLLPPSDPEPTKARGENWLEIDRVLLKNFPFKPADLDELTVTECNVLFAALRDEQGSAVPTGLDQMKAYGRLSPADKLDLARIAR